MQGSGMPGKCDGGTRAATIRAVRGKEHMRSRCDREKLRAARLLGIHFPRERFRAPCDGPPPDSTAPFEGLSLKCGIVARPPEQSF